MALLDSEVQRLRYELGYNVLSVGAEPYIGYHAVFNQVIQVYLNAGASTTSATSVSAASSYTPATLTLASATGFAAGARVAIDVDDRQEVVTVQSVSGSTIVVLLKNAHSGTYPVSVDGGETIVREILGRLRTVSNQILNITSSAGIKRVDEIEFFGETRSATLLGQLKELRNYWRNELASALGVQNLWGLKSGSGGGVKVELY